MMPSARLASVLSEIAHTQEQCMQNVYMQSFLCSTTANCYAKSEDGVKVVRALRDIEVGELYL